MVTDKARKCQRVCDPTRAVQQRSALTCDCGVPCQLLNPAHLNGFKRRCAPTSTVACF